ncbi:tyrosine-type recombinase/integrase [Schaalia hyovaginalis]|uniref:tyrosine-type recombinase/integrase n=1 Tax=Schaalia hyovaginalis TaxID=29316 RepID=UPI002A802EE7|nr:tyrosine-type recombinase/integrase [Schaalia hyovaginalis]MDY3665457.1 tyrosine-type recombinase/integrase [Schaalia hyovaginalis]MDY4491913.1 tyrosine-type recombinase/integrase [Schaalia hyovaginalis]
MHLLGTGRTPATARLRVDYLRRFARAMERGPWEVTTADIVEWSALNMWARDTRRSALASVRGFYRWAEASDYPTIVATDRIPTIRASAPSPRPADDPSVRMAIASEDWRVALAVRLAAELGLRRGEVAKVRGCDVVSDLLGYSLIVHGKGDKTRTIPITADLAQAIIERGSGWTFEGDDHGHLSPAWIGRIVGRALPPGVTMHSLRHRFATRAYERTSDLVAVQKILGHTSPQTTLRYLAIADTSLRRVVEAVA